MRLVGKLLAKLADVGLRSEVASLRAKLSAEQQASRELRSNVKLHEMEIQRLTDFYEWSMQHVAALTAIEAQKIATAQAGQKVER